MTRQLSPGDIAHIRERHRQCEERLRDTIWQLVESPSVTDLGKASSCVSALSDAARKGTIAGKEETRLAYAIAAAFIDHALCSRYLAPVLRQEYEAALRN